MSSRRILSLSVIGTPYPQGSKRLVQGRMVEASHQVRPWRTKIAAAARAELADTLMPAFPAGEPVAMRLAFHMPRPKAHYRPNGELRDTAPTWNDKRPDVDKLMRAVCDALTGIWWADDSQIVHATVAKRYVSAGVDAGITVKAASGAGLAPWEIGIF